MNTSVAMVINGKVINCLFLQPVKIAENENQNNGCLLSSLDRLSPGPAVGTLHALTPSLKKFFSLCHVACGILVPQPVTEPVPPAEAAQSLNHWTTREVPLNPAYSIIISNDVNKQPYQKELRDKRRN